MQLDSGVGPVDRKGEDTLYRTFEEGTLLDGDGGIQKGKRGRGMEEVWIVRKEEIVWLKPAEIGLRLKREKPTLFPTEV